MTCFRRSARPANPRAAHPIRPRRRDLPSTTTYGPRWCVTTESIAANRLFRPQRLRDVGVHPGGQTLLAVAGHRAGRQRHDRDVPPGRAFVLANGPVASSPLISGICTSIRMRSNGSSTARSAASRPLLDHRDAMALLFEQCRDERLVGRIVLGHQHPQRLARPIGGASRLLAARAGVPKPAWRRRSRSHRAGRTA